MNELVVRGKISAMLVETLDSLMESDGIIRPARVVDHARPTNSPLHDYFTWEDSVAAERFRLLEATRLIQVRVTYMDDKKEIVSVRPYLSLPRDRHQDGGYRRQVDVISDSELFGEYLTEALTQYRLFEERYRRIKELEPIFKAGDKVKQKYGKTNTPSTKRNKA